MGLLNFTYREVTAALEDKLGLPFRSGAERTAWYEVDGVQVLRVTAPREHRGNVPVGTLNAIRSQLHLTTPQLADLFRCPMSGRDYDDLVRHKLEDGDL